MYFLRLTYHDRPPVSDEIGSWTFADGVLTLRNPHRPRRFRVADDRLQPLTLSGEPLPAPIETDMKRLQAFGPIEPKLQATPLEGTQWHAVRLGQRPLDVPAGTRVPTLLLTSTPTRRASGSTGCNTFNGSYTTMGTQLTFGPAVSTRMACMGAGSELERDWLAILPKVASYQLRGPVLELFDGTRTLLARLEATP